MTVRIFCFPHAGGGASAFRSWYALMPPQAELVAVQYPGRENRFGEPLVDRMPDLVDEFVDELDLTGSYVLLGHSMGAAVAYELAQELRRRGRAGPMRLVACARQAPTDLRPGTVHRGDDDTLVAELLRLGGTHPEVLADPDLRRTVLEVVRNDYRLAETYSPRPAPPLDCPVSVFVADADPECGEADAAGWAATTTGPTEVRVFRGDHFFLVPQRRPVVAALMSALDLPTAAAVWPSTP
ncbi:alpha/beta fold hydrolase [Micromonospora sp. NPDC000207]|uniref:thioesterase II family protein n=1 Tax=Micromonospora sp. NPDC000207 TaxID=3154246 RepID=UPI003327557A